MIDAVINLANIRRIGAKVGEVISKKGEKRSGKFC